MPYLAFANAAADNQPRCAIQVNRPTTTSARPSHISSKADDQQGPRLDQEETPRAHLLEDRSILDSHLAISRTRVYTMLGHAAGSLLHDIWPGYESFRHPPP